MRPLSLALDSAGITPGMVTSSYLIVSLVAGLLAASGYLYGGLIVFLSGALLDTIDGSLARIRGPGTEFGRYFDGICDRLSEIAFIVGAVLGGVPPSAFLVVAGSVFLLATRIFYHREGSTRMPPCSAGRRGWLSWSSA